MSLPVLTCANIDDPACCTALFDQAYWLLTNLHSALTECFTDDSCGSTLPLAYVTHGDGDDGVRDALTVAIRSVAPSARTSAGASTMLTGAYRATFRVMLKESGWPLGFSTGVEVLPPDPTQQHAVARHSYAHGERLYRKVLWLHRTRAMAPPAQNQPASVVVGPLTPLTPLGGVVGWVIDITLDSSWG